MKPGVVERYNDGNPRERERCVRVMAKEKAKAAAPAKAQGASRFYVLQQGREYYVKESEGVPETKVDQGERMIRIHSSFLTDEEARKAAKDLADHFQGEVRA